jgi:hypothetical protein
MRCARQSRSSNKGRRGNEDGGFYDDDKDDDETDSEPVSPDGSAWSFPSSDGTNWNPIIPCTSRAVPVGNTPYAGSPALITPCPEGSRTTPSQQNHRIASLRNLLGEPSGVTNEELRASLEGTRWDMGSALRFMNHVLNEARRRERANEPGRTAAQLKRDRLLGANSLHHNRRRALDALYERFVAAHPRAQPQLTALNVGVLLAEKGST